MFDDSQKSVNNTESKDGKIHRGIVREFGCFNTCLVIYDYKYQTMNQ